jgi:1,2-diacylglycerol 3-alpha-glucosyltransferase
MRIVMITDSYVPTVDGVVTTVVTTRKKLEDMGHEVTVIAPDPGEEFREDGVIYFPAMAFKQYKGYYLPIFRSNKIEVIKDLKPDIIHIYGAALMALKGMISSYTLGIPSVATYITSIRDVVSTYSPIRLPEEIMDKLVQIYIRAFLRRPHAVIVPTQPIAEELDDQRVVTKRLERIHIGVDTERFRRDEDGGRKIRERYGIAGKKVLICAGRLSAEKNIDLLIRSMGRTDDDTVLIIAGKGPMEQELRQISGDLGLDGKVIFAGFVPDEELVAYYSAADVSASGSRFETQGLTTLEAMACGLPAACADAKAFRETVEDGVNGYRFENNEESCASAIIGCLDNVKDMSPNARRTAEIYSIRETAVKLEKLYLDILGRRADDTAEGSDTM